MTDPRDDEDLRRRFEALRRADAARAPSFDATLARAPARRTPWLVPLAAGAALAVAAIGAWLMRPAVAPSPPPAVATDLPGEMPTDFLLRSAALDATRDTPALRAPENDEVPFL